MPFHENYPYATKPLVYKRMSLWRRFLWWIGPHFTICNLVLVVVSLAMAFAVADAARMGRLPAGW
jgi:hypothetical protein